MNVFVIGASPAKLRSESQKKLSVCCAATCQGLTPADYRTGSVYHNNNSLTCLLSVPFSVNNMSFVCLSMSGVPWELNTHIRYISDRFDAAVTQTAQGKRPGRRWMDWKLSLFWLYLHSKCFFLLVFFFCNVCVCESSVQSCEVLCIYCISEAMIFSMISHVVIMIILRIL